MDIRKTIEKLINTPKQLIPNPPRHKNRPGKQQWKQDMDIRLEPHLGPENYQNKILKRPSPKLINHPLQAAHSVLPILKGQLTQNLKVHEQRLEGAEVVQKQAPEIHIREILLAVPQQSVGSEPDLHK
jgi:hypothetical protein